MIPMVDTPSSNEERWVCIISRKKVLNKQKRFANSQRAALPPFVVVIPIDRDKAHGWVEMEWEDGQSRPLIRYALCGQVRCVCVSRIDLDLRCEELQLTEGCKERIELEMKRVLCEQLWYANDGFAYFGREASVEYMCDKDVDNSINRRGKAEQDKHNVGGGHGRGLVFGQYHQQSFSLLHSQRTLVLPVCVLRSDEGFVPTDLRVTMSYRIFPRWMGGRDGCVSPIDMRPFVAGISPDNLTFKDPRPKRALMNELWGCQATYLGLSL